MNRTKQWLIAVSMLLTTDVMAQIPVITVGNFFQLNKSYPYKLMIDTSLRASWEGAGGANVTWNFNSLDFQNKVFAIDTTVCISPANTLKFLTCGVSGADTANICLVNKSSHYHLTDDYHYYKQTGSKIIELGSDQDNGVSEDINFRFSKPATHNLMPINYLSNVTDSFYNTYDSYLSGRHFVKGKDAIVADGYGTLMIDGRTIQNCIRTAKVHQSIDSNGMLGLRKIYYALFTWYSKDVEGPILTLEKWLDSTSSVMPPVIYEARYYFKNVPTSVSRTKGDLDIKISPNPAQDHLDIQLAKPVSNCVFQLYDIVGRVLLQQQLTSSNNSIPTSQLSTGVYLYKVVNAAGNAVSGKLLKE